MTFKSSAKLDTHRAALALRFGFHPNASRPVKDSIVLMPSGRIYESLKRFIDPRHVLMGPRIAAHVWVMFLCKPTIRLP